MSTNREHCGGPRHGPAASPGHQARRL